MQQRDRFFISLVFPEKIPTKHQIKKIILKVSDLFTKSSNFRPSHYMNDEEFLKGYLLYFVPVNLTKTYKVLKELFIHPAFDKIKDLKIVDIGCGPAPALISVFDLINEKIISPEYVRYVAVELEEKAIDMAKNLIEKLKPEKIKLKYDFIRADASEPNTYLELKHIRPDIIIFSNSLGEILERGNIKIEDFVSSLKSLTYRNSNSTLIFIEPATKKASTRLHLLRDILIEKLKMYPYSPCINSLPCPALKVNNWCYEEIKWSAPEYLNFLSSVGLQVNYLKFSYIVLRQDGANIRDTFEEKGEILKNTSHLIEEKGKSRIWVCWNGELIDLEKLKRDFNEDEVWLKIKKGDYITIDKYLKVNRKIRIPKDAEIKILSL